MQETEVPHRCQQRLQIDGLVRHRQRPLRRAQELVDASLVTPEQLGDDRLLVGEVVVQVARRYAQMRRDVISSLLKFAYGLSDFAV